MSFLVNPYIFGGTVFSPDDLSDLKIWLDPDDSSTVTLSGSNITLLEDKVTGGTLSPTNTPTLVSSGGRDWMSFDGSTDSLSSTTMDTAGNVGAASYTLFVVLKTSSSNTNMTVFTKGTPNLYRTRANFSGAGNIGVVRVGSTSGNVQNNGGSGLNDGNPHWSAHLFDASGLRLRSILDGTEIGSPGTAVSTADDISTTGSNGRIAIGAAWNGTIFNAFYAGEIGEILLYGRLLDAGEISQVGAYLAAKWGV